MSAKIKGIVVGVNAYDHSVDLVLSDGRRLAGVQVLTPNGSTRSGLFDMPATPPKADKWDVTTMTGQDQIAIVDWVGNIPVVVGFLYPQVSQMTFDDPALRVDRHQSDVYTSVDGAGNFELSHPSGAYLRLAETPDHVDLTGQNTDKNFAQDRNTGRALYVRLVVPGAIDLKIAPDGALTLTLGKGATITAPDGITLNTPLVNVPDGDVVASGVSLVGHPHGAVKAGPDQSGPPVAS